MEEVTYNGGIICTVVIFEFSCCDLIGQLVEKLQSHQEIELVSDLAETDENLMVSYNSVL